MSVASRVIYGSPEVVPPPEAPLYAYGDGDDSMRLTVLLAQQLMPGYDATMRDDLARCMNPRAPTVERIDALGRALLVEARAPRGTRALVDVEALHVAGRESWEGDRSGTLARRLYDVVHHAAERGGWWLYRPGRQGPGDDPLSDLSAESEIAADAAPEVARFAVELHPVAAALLRRGVVSPSTLRQVCDELPDPDAYLVRVAYDTLSWRAADALRLVSVLRGPQRFNGVLGPLVVRDGEVSAEGVPRGVLDELVASGLLLRGDGTLRLPGSVRRVLQQTTRHTNAPELLRLHERVAGMPLEGVSDAELLEIHHHAVRAGDVARAKASGRLHGLSLRSLATRLGTQAAEQRDAAGFERAASLFRYVLDHFDPEDAFAWEYLGYNLARARSPGRAEEIAEAYRRAHTLWPANPLYHGRLLGFRAELGEEVADEAIRLIDRYASLSVASDDDRLSYFADAVLGGMERGKRLAQMQRVRVERGALLEASAPRAFERLQRTVPAGEGR